MDRGDIFAQDADEKQLNPAEEEQARNQGGYARRRGAVKNEVEDERCRRVGKAGGRQREPGNTLRRMGALDVDIRYNASWIIQTNARRPVGQAPATSGLTGAADTMKINKARVRVTRLGAGLLEDVFFYPKLRRFYRRALSGATGQNTIVDVGANRGQYLLFALKNVPNARVFSIEANEDLMPRLKEQYGFACSGC